MAKAPQKRYIDSASVDEELRPAVDLLADILNVFMEEVENAFTNRIDFENLNQYEKQLQIRVDANGTPIFGGTFRNELTDRKSVSGTLVIKAQDINQPNNYVSGTPFISFTEADRVVTIKNITNLDANTDYLLTIIVF